MHQVTTSPLAGSHKCTPGQIKGAYRENIFVPIGIPYLVKSARCAWYPYMRKQGSEIKGVQCRKVEGKKHCCDWIIKA